METKHFETLTKLLQELEDLALSNREIVFRGHQNASWKIESTYARYTTRPYESWETTIDEMLSHFLSNALTIGSIPFLVTDRRSRLEYGRHHGVPTPVVDYTHSPYVALYFAFNGLQYRHGSDAANAAIFALDLGQLGMLWAELNNAGSFDQKIYEDFLYERPGYFQHGYPSGRLKFIPFCASWNQRMRSQLGCFIYDTLRYDGAEVGSRSFDELVEKFNEPLSSEGIRTPTLTKFIVPHSEAKNVFSRLELMNMTGTKLLDHEGLASDVRNAYNYNRKTGYAWNLQVDYPDDTKM